MESNQQRELDRTGSVQSVESIRATSEIEEDPAETPVRVEENKVYVAVAAELKAGKATLLWAIQSNPSARTVVVVHVHRPAQMIPMLGGKFPASSLNQVQVNAYRQLERDKMNKRLDEYVAVCSKMKVRAEKLVIENDDITKGLVELIAQFGITKLVMGAAADKHYSKKMKEVKSKTAIGVRLQADPSCMIWFVCKGKLICTRDSSVHVSRTESSPLASQSSISSQSEQLRSSSLPLMENESFYLLQSPLQECTRNMSLNFAKTPSHQGSRLSIPGSSADSWESISISSQMSDHLSASNTDERFDNSGPAAEQLTSRPLPLMENESFKLLQNPLQGRSRHTSTSFAKIPSLGSRLSIPGSSSDTWEVTSSSSQMSDHLSVSNNDEGLDNSGSAAEQLRSRSSPLMENGSFNLLQSPLQEHYRHKSLNFVKTSSQGSRLSIPGSSADIWEAISSSSQVSDHLSASNNDERLHNSESVPLPKEAELASLSPVHDSNEDLELSSSHNELEDLDSDADLFNKLQAALKEAENLKHEAYEESCKRTKAEMQLILSRQKAKASENLYAKEVRYRKEIEEALDREKLEVKKLKIQQAEALEREKIETEKLKNQQAEVSEHLQNAIEQKLEMELKLAESERTTKYFEEKLSATRYLLHSLQEECDILQRERDNAIKEAEKLRLKTEQTNAGNSWPFNSEFSYLELEQATQNFSNSLKIGEGGYGKVYKGSLGKTTVAIKMLHPRNLQGRAEFHQEVVVLSRVRHQNLVTLIGACSDAFALIYEFLPNGSLEDCLAHINGTPLLTWQVCTRIIAEICSALIFLHSNKPHPVVHGDLKPANILLDANLVSKLSDFGICRFLVESNTNTTLYRKTNPKGTFAYIDPEFLITGELVPRSDVYALGIIILRLLTGKPALGIAREVQEALDKGYLHAIIDPFAGDWPFVQAKQLAHLGLRCCDMSRRNRPDLATEVWRVVEPMMKAASLSVSSFSFNSFSDEHDRIPSYFICPIFQEIMRDPHSGRWLYI